jgi:hypothetical protein
MAKKREKLFAEALAAAQEVNQCITELIRLGVPLTPAEQAKLERMLRRLTDEIDKVNKPKKDPGGPNPGPAELAEALDAYTDPSHPDYDAEFDRRIRTLRPDWFGGDRSSN